MRPLLSSTFPNFSGASPLAAAALRFADGSLDLLKSFLHRNTSAACCRNLPLPTYPRFDSAPTPITVVGLMIAVVHVL